MGREALARLAGLPTANLSDALDALGMSGTMIGIAPLGGRAPYRMVGTARTVLQGARRVDAEPHTGYARHLGLVDGGLNVGDVVLISAPPGIAASSWGFLLSQRCKAQGVAGTVLDGTVRDPGEIMDLGYALYARGHCPAGSKLRLETLAIDEPMLCCGVRVSPGDIVVGDDSGVVVIPPARLDEVIAGAEKIFAREQELARVLAAGGRFSGVA